MAMMSAVMPSWLACWPTKAAALPVRLISPSSRYQALSSENQYSIVWLPSPTVSTIESVLPAITAFSDSSVCELSIQEGCIQPDWRPRPGSSHAVRRSEWE